jgi:hypothetical protein
MKLVRITFTMSWMRERYMDVAMVLMEKEGLSARTLASRGTCRGVDCKEGSEKETRGR